MEPLPTPTAPGSRRGLPLPAALAALSIPERMAEVIRQRLLFGQPTTLEDFREALETGDLSESELRANLTDAKRLLHPEMVRHEQPAAPVHPWDHDLDYRRERVARAVQILAEETAAARRRLIGRYTPAEIEALWPAIVGGLTARLAADLPGRLSPDREVA